MSNDSGRLARLTTPEEYRPERANVFPSPTSLQWFMRTRRDALLKAQAVLRINGRIVIDPERFDDVVLADGHKQVQHAA